MRVANWPARWPLVAAILFEGGLVPLALGFAWLLGVQPWAAFAFTADGLLLAIVATLPLLAGLALLVVADPPWFRDLDAVVRALVAMLFRGRGFGAVVAVAACAGLGEELLFRGVLQAWLTGLGGPWAGVVLAGMAFGAVHAVSRAYFVVATAMGLYLGVLYHASGNLLVPVVVHGLYDAVAIAWLLRGNERAC